MMVSELWGAALWSISLTAWSFAFKASVSDRPRLPQEQTYLTLALNITVLYIFPAVGTLLLTTWR